MRQGHSPGDPTSSLTANGRRLSQNGISVAKKTAAWLLGR